MTSMELMKNIGLVKSCYILEAQEPEKAPRSRPKYCLLIAALIGLLAFTGYAATTRMLNWTPFEQEQVDSGYQDIPEIGEGSKTWGFEDINMALEFSLQNANASGGTLSCTGGSYLPIDEPPVGVIPDNVALGSEFWLEKWNGTAYEEVPTKSGQPWLTGEKSIAKHGEEYTGNWPVSWEDVYGSLEEGNYRVGMTLNFIMPDGQVIQKGCYTKFRLYNPNMQPLVEEFKQAYSRLQTKESFHVISTEWMHTKYQDKKNLEYTYLQSENWKNGSNALCSATYILEASSGRELYAHGGVMTRDGKSYSMKWTGEPITSPLSRWENITWADDMNYTLWQIHFDTATFNLTDAAQYGDTVCFYREAEVDLPVLDPQTGEQKLDENGYPVWESVPVYAESKVTYNESGDILGLEYAMVPELPYEPEERELIARTQILDNSPEEIDAAIRSVDVETPPVFSYKQDLERLADGTFNDYTDGFMETYQGLLESGRLKVQLEQRTDGFVNTAAQEVTKDNAVQLAAKEVQANRNTTIVYFDSSSQIWKVEFLLSYDPLPYHAVYLNTTGATQLVVERYEAK